jgi:hypothetical protein
LKEDIENYEFEVNSWGSVQYAGALRAFKVFMERVDAKGFDETVEEFEGMGVKFDIDLGPKDEVIEKVKAALLKDVQEFYGGEGDEEYLEEHTARLNGMRSIDDAFEACKNMAWDLWAAAKFIGNACGVNIEGAPKSRGVGPVGNIMAQAENLDTGLYCAILKAKALVENEGSFADFDT